MHQTAGTAAAVLLATLLKVGEGQQLSFVRPVQEAEGAAGTHAAGSQPEDLLLLLQGCRAPGGRAQAPAQPSQDVDLGRRR